MILIFIIAYFGFGTIVGSLCGWLFFDDRIEDLRNTFKSGIIPENKKGDVVGETIGIALGTGLLWPVTIVVLILLVPFLYITTWLFEKVDELTGIE